MADTPRLTVLCVYPDMSSPPSEVSFRLSPSYGLLTARSAHDWFLETVGLLGIPSPTRMWQDFNEFMADFYERRKSEGFSGEDLTMMPVPELLDFMIKWRDRSP